MSYVIIWFTIGIILMLLAIYLDESTNTLNLSDAIPMTFFLIVWPVLLILLLHEKHEKSYDDISLDISFLKELTLIEFSLLCYGIIGLVTFCFFPSYLVMYSIGLLILLAIKYGNKLPIKISIEKDKNE